ncbi:MAG: flagellar hook-associated protein FlgK [Oleiphilus sp.]
MGDLIGIGLSGLQAHQTALSVTGNNVSNTNTPGYSRQDAVFVDNPSVLSGAGFIGQGVTLSTIRRNAEEFINTQLRADTTVYNERNIFKSKAESVDNLLASTTTGLTPAMSAFFQAFQGGADDPTSVPQRQLLLTQSEGLVSRFKSLDSRLNSQMQSVDFELDAAVSEINSLSQSLAQLNQSISVAVGAGQGDQPNSLLDARDEALRKLSELVTVSVFPEGQSGQLNIFIGNGQPLVLGNSFSKIASVQSPVDANQKEVALIINGESNIISNELSGGKVGGLLNFRNNELSSAINGLGRVALVLADTVNKQHSLGMDLESNLGGEFFQDVNETTLARSRITSNSLNTPPVDQVMQINIIDSGELTTSDYELRFEGPRDNDFNIVRLSDGENVLKSTLPGIYPANVEVDGFQLQFDAGTFKVGDRFSIQPTRTGARDIDLQIARVEDIALASPIRSNSHEGNTGNASLSLGKMLDVTNPQTNQVLSGFAVPGQLSPPLEIEFLTDTVYQVMDVTDPANPVPLSPAINNQLYRPGVTNTLFTSDPGEQRLSALGSDSFQVPLPALSTGTLVNGFGAQNLSILTRNVDSGVVTSQSLAIAANSSAETIAMNLQSIQGVQATAYTHVRLDNFVDNGDATPLSIELNGQALTLPAGTVASPDTLVDLINSNSSLQNLNIYAVSSGTALEIHSTTGKDLQIVVGGVGDSVDVSSVDPYSAGAVSLSTQTVTSGDGVNVGGAIDVTLADGISLTADVDSVFEQAPVGTSSYLGFQFEITGEPKAGDSFTISYNQGGVSDNRNALDMAALERASTVGGGVISYGEAYSQIIEEIGTVTNRARLDTEAAKALLTQSENNRESISGVNLDEEAGRLVQYQAAYNASAQVVSIARQLFDTLLNTFR